MYFLYVKRIAFVILVNMKWWKIVIIPVLLVGGIWMYRAITTPAPGQKIEDLGREHVSLAQVESTSYNSNPPTSGPHVASWVKPGVYDTPKNEGELIHALEHGYIIISYNCNVHLQEQGARNKEQRYFSMILNNDNSLVQQVSAHEEEGEASESGDLSVPTEASGSPSSLLRTSATNEGDACKTLVQQLSDLAKKKKLFKLVVVPRPQLGTTMALTAWNYIDKFDQFDAKRIERFIDYHRDHGPEQTTE